MWPLTIGLMDRVLLIVTTSRQHSTAAGAPARGRRARGQRRRVGP